LTRWRPQCTERAVWGGSQDRKGNYRCAPETMVHWKASIS